MVKVRRVLSVACLLLFLGLPLAAQAEREAVVPLAGFLQSLWEWVTAPLAPITSLWEADEITDPTIPLPDPTSRGGWDPLG
jgi:hypothetical protein